MTHKNNKLRNKIWSLALCASMILSCLPISAFAESQNDEYIHEHTAECGHSYGEEESTETVAPAYTAEDVKAMIDALPSVSELESMDSDELNSVYEQAQEAYDAFETLTDEEQIELADELVKLRDVLDFMTTPVTPLATEAETLRNGYHINYITYSDGVSQYFTYNARLYKVTYTNLKWTTVGLGAYKLDSKYVFRIMTSGEYIDLYKGDKTLAYTSDIPITQGAELICYNSNEKVVATITCLELNENPTWNWASDYFSAQVVFTAKNYDVCATVNAGVSTVIDRKATNCLEKDTVTYTGSVSFGGSTYTDKKTVENGAIGPHSFAYSVSGNVITESCGNNCGHKETATLTVDATASLLYTGSAVKPLKVEYSADWQGDELSISYTDDCVALGTHSGSITIGGVTATKDFVVTTSTLVTEDNYKSLGLDSSYIGYYTISRLSELYSFAAVTRDNPSANAVLLKNIDMENRAWTPIGTKDKPYTGTFDGNGKSISKLSFDDLTADYVGLFGYIKAPAVIRNVSLKNSSIRAKEWVGGIVGYAYANGGNITIENCTNEAEIYSEYVSDTGATVFSYAGGIVGYVSAVSSCDITIQNCTNNAKISGIGSYMGGVVGYIYVQSADAKVSLVNCTNSGSEVSDAKGYCVGGVIASASASYGNIILKNCKNSATVTGSYYVGGLAGGITAYNGGTIEVSDCSNSGGSITSSTASSSCVAGIIGKAEIFNYGGMITIANCANSGTVQASSADAGGIVGYTQVYGQYENDVATLKIYGCNNSGSIISSSSYVGGIIGYAYTRAERANVKCTLEITQCFNTGAITGTFNVGGIAGRSYVYGNSASTSNIKISTCYNTGNVTSTSTSSNRSFAGGIVGFGYMHIDNNTDVMTLTTELSNCYNTGTVTGVGTGVGGIWGERYYAGYTSNNSNYTAKFITSDNYYLTGCATDGKNTVQFGLGSSSLGGTTADGDGKYKGMSAGQFSSGEVAYLLNGSTNAGTYKQTIGTDNSPNFTGKNVYMGYVCGSGNSDPVYQNSTDGILSEPHPDHNIGDNGFCTYCGTSVRPALNNGFYEIKNLGHLQWFADYVNAVNTSINGKLMADIDASTLTTLAIGVNGKSYSGTFDGNGYTITIGLDSTAQYAAPFQYVNGATIKNLTVKGSITTNQKFAASIVGLSDGETTIENCLSYVTINSTISGDGTHGGLVANVSSGTMTINNCGFVGAINGSNTNNCGGLVGWSNGTTKISNSFLAATFGVKGDGGCTFSRGKNITVTNCYYLNALGTAQGTPMTSDQLTSGELAYLLNGSKDNGSWKQTLGESGDATPNFSGGAVYKTTGVCEGYTNNESEKNRNHSLNDLGCCTICNKYHEIDTIAKLLYFAERVNAGEYSINAKLMADLDLTGETWTPIAYLAMSDSATVGYTGIFDGNGHVISNITVITPTAATANGFFGIITTGTVKHLGIDGLTFDNNEYDHRAGGIAGQLMSGGTI